MVLAGCPRKEDYFSPASCSQQYGDRVCYLLWAWKWESYYLYKEGKMKPET